jgi:hypothetical protein
MPAPHDDLIRAAKTITRITKSERAEISVHDDGRLSATVWWSTLRRPSAIEIIGGASDPIAAKSIGELIEKVDQWVATGPRKMTEADIGGLMPVAQPATINQAAE